MMDLLLYGIGDGDIPGGPLFLHSFTLSIPSSFLVTACMLLVSLPIYPGTSLMITSVRNQKPSIENQAKAKKRNQKKKSYTFQNFHVYWVKNIQGQDWHNDTHL